MLTRAIAGRDAWRSSVRPPHIEPARPGEESVWDYPRPPQIRDTDARVTVASTDTPVADTVRAKNVIETAGAPVHFIHPQDVSTDLLRPTDYITVCEWKGAAVHFDLVLPDRIVEHAAFVYPDPFDDLSEGYADIAGWFAFYPAKVDCTIAGERVRPQSGGYYAGWVTDAIKGPVKGEKGSTGW